MALLSRLGWRVTTIWECETKDEAILFIRVTASYRPARFIWQDKKSSYFKGGWRGV